MVSKSRLLVFKTAFAWKNFTVRWMKPRKDFETYSKDCVSWQRIIRADKPAEIWVWKLIRRSGLLDLNWLLLRDRSNENLPSCLELKKRITNLHLRRGYYQLKNQEGHVDSRDSLSLNVIYGVIAKDYLWDGNCEHLLHDTSCKKKLC